jgi:biotin transporter BioY
MDASQKGENLVQVIYAAPFILIALVSYLICLAVPRFRGNALQALVAPVTFGFCSIVGMVVMVLLGNALSERFHFNINPGPLVGMKGILIGFLIYFVPGILGAWLAVHLINKIERRFQHS